MQSQPGGASQANKRWHRRVPVTIVVRLHAVQEGWILDLSARGARLEHEDLLRSGDRCAIRLCLNDEPFTFLGRIVWCRAVWSGGKPANGMRFQSGLAFDRIPAAAKPLLAQLLTG